jgi:rare lipoprotein A (peptidoglycan hydrolase)
VPFINGRFYINPAHGRALERARLAEAERDEQRQQQAGHWVTINGNHVWIRDTPPGGAQHRARNTKQFTGDATYYNLPGAKTASGQRFDPNKMAAAMTAEKVKLGQTVTVTYTHKDAQGNTAATTISVVVNDRGPFARNPDGTPIHPLAPDPRGVIDLTPAAFRELTGTLRAGRVHVTVTVPNE